MINDPNHSMTNTVFFISGKAVHLRVVCCISKENPPELKYGVQQRVGLGFSRVFGRSLSISANKTDQNF